PPPSLYTLSLHDALPIFDVPRMKEGGLTAAFFSIWVDARYGPGTAFRRALNLIGAVRALADTNPEVELATSADQVRAAAGRGHRSEEHTSELQSLAYLVC